jgi:hypothetical protein
VTAVTRTMLTAAHGEVMKHGDVILSADLLTRIYCAMRAREPLGDVKPCPTCESLSRAVMMDQTGKAG